MAQEALMQEKPLVVSSELKYTKKDFSHPKYKLHNLYPLSGLQTQTVNTSGGQEIIFQLPSKVFNPSRCVLKYTMTPAANAGAGLHYFAHNTPLSIIRQIQLYTQSGVYLCDVYNVNKYLNTVFYPETSSEDFQTNENISVGVQNTSSIGTYPNNTAGTSKGVENYTQRGITNGVGAILPADSDGTAAVNVLERMYFNVGVVNNQTPVVNIQFPMKYLYNTIFNIDKDLYFGEVLQLRIVFDNCNSAYFVAGQLGAGPPITVDISLNTAIMPGNVNLSNIAFYCAVEQDLTVSQQIINQFNTVGLNIPIPYVYTFKTSLTSTSQTLSQRFNRAHGRKLRRIYHAPYHLTEESGTAYMRDNISGAKTVNSFYTMLNNDRLQEFNVSCPNAEDYMTLRSRLKGSCFSNVDSYQNVWFWVDDFTSEGPLCEPESQDIMYSSGVPLDSEQKWDIYMTMNNARNINHYTFAVTEKELRLFPNSITVS